MFEIKGDKCTAICYAKTYEDEAIEQIRRMCNYDITLNSKVCIMPDVHVGKGCTIGTTMTIVDKVVPNIVGVDIGCGMYTVNLGSDIINLQLVDEITHYIPSGRNIWNSRYEKFDLEQLRCYRQLKRIDRIKKSLGTLGGGNHFIEIDKSTNGIQYLVIHTGSRNLGKQVAELYQQLAIDLNKGKAEYLKAKDELIQTYKEQGRRSEIQEALKQLKWNKQIINANLPDDLCYLNDEYMDDYLHDVEICQEFAKRNREIIAEIILDKLGLIAYDNFHTIHNYIDMNEMILRKGAIAAHKDERILIPINMRDGSIIATGKGNPEWNYSAPHGAGRILSRKDAKTQLSLEDYISSMKHIYSTSVNALTLDESPMAYKSLDDIIDVIQESVNVLEVLKPIYNFKAS